MNMDPSALVLLGIPGLALCVLAALIWMVFSTARDRAATRTLTVCVVSWLLYTAALALSGFLRRLDLAPLPMLLVLGPMLALVITFVRSRLGAVVARDSSLAWLVGFHAFRLPLELVMHQAAREGTMPPQMTFTGANFDIVTGASALVLALWLVRAPVPRWVLWGWNLMGTGLLMSIMVIAIASLPKFHAFGSEPARLNTWVTYFPFVWLPAGLVGSALLGHGLLWRRLLATQAAAGCTPAEGASSSSCAPR